MKVTVRSFLEKLKENEGKDKRLWIAAGLLATLIVVGGVFGFRAWRHGPTYALLQVKKSIKTHDRTMFHQYVDLEAMISRGVEALAKSDNKSQRRVAPDLFEMVGMLADSDYVVKGIDSFIESTQEKRSGLNLLGLGDWGQLEPKKITNKSRNGKLVQADLNLKHKKYGADLVVTLNFRTTKAGHLQVTEIANLMELLASFGESRKTWQIAQNKPVQEELDKALALTGVSMRLSDEAWFKYLTLTLKFVNQTEKPISSLKWDLSFSVKKGSHIGTLYGMSISFRQFPPGGQTSVVTSKISLRKLGNDGAEALWKRRMNLESVVTSLKVREVGYADGSSLALPYPKAEKDPWKIL